jgi:hypothetical protein
VSSIKTAMPTKAKSSDFGLIIDDRLAQPITVLGAVIASIPSDDLRFFFRNILVYMLKDEALEVRIGLGEFNQSINMVPLVGQQATECVTVFFLQATRVALPESFERIMQPLPVDYVAHLASSLFHFGGETWFSTLRSTVSDGSRYHPGKRKYQEPVGITGHEAQYRIPTETFTS